MGKSLLTIGLAAVLLAAGCTGDKTPETTPEVKPATLGLAGYDGLKLGMAKDAALATGKLAAAPTSTMRGCEDFPYKGGPAPDPARMAAEKAAEQKSDELNRKADEADRNRKPLGANPGAQQYADSAAESAAVAKAMAESAEAIATVAEKNEARDKAFRAAGGVAFSSKGVLRALAAPPGAKTDEGIGAGASLDELKKAYEGRVMEETSDGGYELRIGTDPAARLQFTFGPDKKVATIMLVGPDPC
jgi:hypothetical protein